MPTDPHPEIRTVAILGLGLIGGSLARDLSARGIEVLGWDRDENAVHAAVQAGAVADARLLDDAGMIRRAEVVIVAIPVLAATRLLRELEPHLDSARLITDAGSTKDSIVREAQALGLGARFVGSHPFCGDHRSGWNASRAGLFAGARVFLCPAPSTEPAAMRLAQELWTLAGARTEVMDAIRHDVRLGWTSHMPQIASTAVALAIAQTGTSRGELGPGGRDVTRLAGSSPELWADVLLDNAESLDSALAMLAVQLGSIHDAVAAGDRARLVRLLEDARKWHGTDP